MELLIFHNLFNLSGVIIIFIRILIRIGFHRIQNFTGRLHACVDMRTKRLLLREKCIDFDFMIIFVSFSTY